MILLYRSTIIASLLALFFWSTACDDILSPDPERVLLLQPSGATLVVGESLPFGLPDAFKDGSGPIQWSVSNPAVAMVDQDGMITALRDGQTGVRAVAGDRIARGLLTVTAASAPVVSDFRSVAHPYPAERTPLDLFDVWGAESDDVFAVGQSGTILHWDGTAWRAMPGADREDLRAVWGTTGDQVYAAGDRMYHYDGTQWEPVDEQPPAPLNALTGTAWNEIYGVGTGVLLGYDGSRWTTLAAGQWGSYGLPPMEGVWAASPEEVYMAGNAVFHGSDGWEHPLLLKYDGREVIGFDLWERGGEREQWLRGIAGRDDGTVIAVGRRWDRSAYERRIHAVRLDGTSWEFINSEEKGNLYDIWPSATGTWFAVGEIPSTRGAPEPGLIARFDGESWEHHATAPGLLHAVWGARSSAVFAVGDDGVAMHYDGTEWTQVPTPVQAEAPPMPEADLWGASPDDIYAVGSEGGVMNYDGTSWSAQVSGTEADLHGVWGASSTAVYAVGAEGTILRSDGEAWRIVHFGGEDLHAVWGVTDDLVYAVGDGGRVLRFDGESWRDLDVGTDADLRAVWGLAPDDILLGGTQGTLIRYDGSRWTEVRSGADETYHAIWGTAPDNLYIGGSELLEEGLPHGFIMRYQGTAWSRVSINGIPYYDIWGSGPNDVYAMGGMGGHIEARILHFDGSRWSVPLSRPGEQEVRAGWGTAGSPVHFLVTRPSEVLQGERP